MAKWISDVASASMTKIRGSSRPRTGTHQVLHFGNPCGGAAVSKFNIFSDLKLTQVASLDMNSLSCGTPSLFQEEARFTPKELPLSSFGT